MVDPQGNSIPSTSHSIPYVAPVVTSVNSSNLLYKHIQISPFTGDNEDVIEWLLNFETATSALNLGQAEMFRILPYYLQGTARKWYNLLVSPYGDPIKPTNYEELREKMIQGLCPSDYKALLSEKLHNARQKPNQPTASFIYEVQELYVRMHGEVSETILINGIIERLLPTVRFVLTLQKPKTLTELINAGKLADQANAHCNISSFNPSFQCNQPTPQFIPQVDQSLFTLLNQLQQKCEALDEKLNKINRSPTCNFCHRRGHTEAECYKKNRPYQQQQNERLVSTNQTLPNDRPQQVDQPSQADTSNNWRNDRKDSKRNQWNRKRKDNDSKNNPHVKVITKSSYENDENESDSEAKYECIQVSTIVPTLTKKLIHKQIKINNKSLPAMLDTGSEMTLITKDLANELGLTQRKYTGPTPFAANGKPLPIFGEVDVQFKICDGDAALAIDSTVQIVEKLPKSFKILIGQDILSEAKITIDCANGKIQINHQDAVEHQPLIYLSEDDNCSDTESCCSSDTNNTDSSSNSLYNYALDLEVSKTLPTDTTQTLQDLAQEYRDIFAVDQKELGRTNLFVHKIETGSHPPIASTPYQQSAQKREITKALVDEMLRDDLIVESFSPWCSPVVLVSKKTKDWRLCVDYRKLNAVTKKDRYPLPDINTSLDSLQGSRYFSLLDLRSGYHQVELDPNDRQKTAFVTSFGMYEYRVMPFGLCNAPATFQRLMDVCLAGLKYNSCLVYIDDIIIFSKTIEDHFLRLRAVFERLRSAGLTLKPEKCQFFYTKILYLGHVISAAGQEPDPEKIRTIKNYPVPVNLRDIRAFVALCSYYRKFIKDFAKIARPLTQLTRKEVPFVWGYEQNEAFETLKNHLCSADVLEHFDPSLETQLRTDASDHGLGAIVLQRHDNKWKPIAFASRQLRGAEINYPVSDKECLAIMYAVEKFRHYLEGIKFEVVTDHCALCFLRSKAKLPPRLMRYSITLQSFDFNIVYKSGKVHADADCLSRYPSEDPDHNQKEEDYEQGDDIFALLIQEENNDLRDLLLEQRSDPFIQQQFDQLNNLQRLDLNQRKKLTKLYRIRAGLVQRKINTSYGDDWVPLLPANLINDILKAYHNDPISGHCGFYQTYNRIKSRYYWPRMHKTIMDHVQKCSSCQLNKQGDGNTDAPLKSINVGKPFEKLGIDIVGPLPFSSGKKYIIVATDYFTRWVETKALSHKTATVTAKFLIENILSRHGCPKTILSDQGTNFTSNIISKLSEFMTTRWQFSTTYHPQTNGLTERVNRTLCQMLIHYANENKSKWTQVLPLITFAYNNAINFSTKASPFFLLYGRQPDLPIDININKPLETSSIDNYTSFIYDEWKNIHEKSKIFSLEAKQRQKEYHDSKHRLKTFNIGDKVLMKINIRKDKLDPKYEDKTFEVTDKIGETTYLIKYQDQEPIRAHGSQLKTFHDNSTSSKPKSSNNLIMMILMVLMVCGVKGNEYGSTVVWRKHDAKFIKGFINVNYKIIVNNPCATFNATNVKIKVGSECYLDYRGDLTVFDCLQAIQQNPLCRYPIESVCEAKKLTIDSLTEIIRNHCYDYVRGHLSTIHDTFKSRKMILRRKRAWYSSLRSMTIVTALVIGYEKVKSWFTSDSATTENLQLMLTKATETTKEIMKAHQSHISKIASEVKLQGLKLQTLEQVVPLMTLHSAEVVYQIQRIKEIMAETSVSLETKDRLPDSFISFFNVTLPCGKGCPLDAMKNLKINIENQLNYFDINLEFRVPNYATEVIVQSADPFEIWMDGDNNTQCKRHYTGHTHVIINETSGEMCSMEESELDDEEFFLRTGQFCTKIIEPTAWSTTDCSQNLDPQFPQIKSVDNDIYVYCKGHNITLFNSTRQCPNNVLKLSKSVSFQIGNEHFNSYDLILNIVSNTKEVSTWSTVINWRINRDDAELIQLDSAQQKIDTLSQLVEEVKNLPKQPTSWFFEFKKEIMNVLLAIITLSILLMIITQLIKLCIGPKPVVVAAYTRDYSPAAEQPKHKHKHKKTKTISVELDYRPLSQLI